MKKEKENTRKLKTDSGTKIYFRVQTRDFGDSVYTS